MVVCPICKSNNVKELWWIDPNKKELIQIASIRGICNNCELAVELTNFYPLLEIPVKKAKKRKLK